MKIPNLFMIIVSVALSAMAQIFMKKGMIAQDIQHAIHDGYGIDILNSIVFSIYITFGLTLFALSAVFWLFVLSRVPLSLAYPFVALGIVATVLAGNVVFGETVSWQTIGGVFFIVLGVVLVGISA